MDLKVCIKVFTKIDFAEYLLFFFTINQSEQSKNNAHLHIWFYGLKIKIFDTSGKHGRMMWFIGSAFSLAGNSWKKNELKLGTADSRVQCIRRFQVMRSWQVAHRSEDTHNFCIPVTFFWQINFLSFIFLPLGQMIRLHFSCHPPVQRQSVNGTLLPFTSWLQWSLSLQCTVLWVERYCWLREWFHSCFKCSLVLW